MKKNFKVIVIGLGGLGSAATYWLSRRIGDDVLGLEQFEIGHLNGGSQDHSRIIRLSYHTTGYVELAKHAYAAWDELERDAEEKLIVKTGGIDLSPADATIPISDYTESMTACGVPYEMLDAKEAMYRWPQWNLTDDIQVLYQEESGIAPAAKAMAAHLRMAKAHGAILQDYAPVTAITPIGDEVEVTAGGETYRCEQLVIASGAWTNTALGYLGEQINLTITQEQVAYYDTPHVADFMPDRFPIWIWMTEPCYYGFPVYGENGPKVSQDAGGHEVTADTRTFEPDVAYDERLDNFVKQYLPKAHGGRILTRTCLYTMPPDRDFVLSKLPNQPNVQVVVGAAQAFKYSSQLGRMLSELALDGSTPHDISPFAFDRPILFEENPVKSFMI
ncbi:MAG: N-methyl-L-tryptophan oxidase [Chloroflexota bacterium]